MKMKWQKEDWEKELKEDYRRWEYLYREGGQDPGWSDGANLNLIRNHIIHDKRKIDEEFGEEQKPQAYYLPLPPEMPDDYMAKGEEILAQAKRSLSLYQADENYQYLRRHEMELSSQELKETRAGYLLHLVMRMQVGIQNKDLVFLRVCNRYDSREDFKECRAKVQTVLEDEERQFSLFLAMEL